MAKSKTTQIAVRLDNELLAKVDAIGRDFKPLPMNRTDMVKIALADYVERHAKDSPPPTKRERTS